MNTQAVTKLGGREGKSYMCVHSVSLMYCLKTWGILSEGTMLGVAGGQGGSGGVLIQEANINRVDRGRGRWANIKAN